MNVTSLFHLLATFCFDFCSAFLSHLFLALSFSFAPWFHLLWDDCCLPSFCRRPCVIYVQVYSAPSFMLGGLDKGGIWEQINGVAMFVEMLLDREQGQTNKQMLNTCGYSSWYLHRAVLLTFGLSPRFRHVRWFPSACFINDRQQVMMTMMITMMINWWMDDDDHHHDHDHSARGRHTRCGFTHLTPAREILEDARYSQHQSRSRGLELFGSRDHSIVHIKVCSNLWHKVSASGWSDLPSDFFAQDMFHFKFTHTMIINISP